MNRKKYIKLILSLFALILSTAYTAFTQNPPCVGSTTFTVNPQPVGGGYAPGTVVTFCYTVSGYSQAGTNWFEGIGIDLGSGWLAGSINPVTPPNNLSGAGQWIWVANGFTFNGVYYNPGYYYDYDSNGINYNVQTLSCRGNIYESEKD
jgi:hypothetical protein